MSDYKKAADNLKKWIKEDEMKKQTKRVKVTANCASFNIEATVVINTDVLTHHEANNVVRQLKHKLTQAISSLPFAHIYPHEVKVK